MTEERRAALVLSGGGALGAAHLGVLRAMEERAIRPDFAVGVSIGAVIAAGAACGMTSAAMEDVVRQAKFLKFLVDPLGAEGGLSSGRRMHEFFHGLFGDRRIEDLPIPLAVGTTDFDTGEQVMLTSGLLTDALRASVCVPILFEPYRHPVTGHCLVDGGLSQNFPLDYALEKYNGAHIIGSDLTVLSPLAEIADERPLLFGRSRRIIAYHQRMYKIFFRNQQRHFPQDARVVRIEPALGSALAVRFDRRHLARLVDCGYAAAVAALDAALQDD